MADYSYAGLSVVVRAVTEPMVAAIKAAAVTAGDAAAADLEKSLAAGIKAGVTKGWADTSKVSAEGMKSAGQEAGKAAVAAFSEAFTSGMKKAGANAGAALEQPLTVAARLAARNAAAAAAANFGSALATGMKKAAATAGSAMEAPMTTAATRAARKAATAAATAFTTAMTPVMRKAGQAAGDALGSMTASAQKSAKKAAASAATTFDATLTPGVAAAGAAAGTALATMTGSAVAAAAKAGVAASTAFGEATAPRMKAIGAGLGAELAASWTPAAAAAALEAGKAAGWTFTATVTKVMREAGAAGGAAFAGPLAVEAGVAADEASASLLSRMAAGAKEAGLAAGRGFVTTMSETVLPGMEALAVKASAGLASVGKSGVRAMGAVAQVAGLAGGAFLYEAVKAGIAYNVLYSQSLKAFTVILGGQKQAVDMMAQITKFAKTSPFPRQQFIESTQTLLGFGFAAKQIIPTLSAIQDAVAVTRGASAETFKNVVNDLAKVQSQGKFTARTLNELGTYGIDAAALIGKAMNLTSTQVREDITHNKLDTQVALNDLITQMQIKFAGGAAGLKSTWTGAKQSIQAAMRDIGSAIVAPFISPTGGGLAIQWANKLGKALWGIEPFVKPLVDALMYSLNPAIQLVNRGVNDLLNSVDKLSGKNIDAATAAVKKFGAAGVAASVGLSVFTGGKLLTSLPIVGDLVKGLLAPFEALLGVLGEFAAPIAALALMVVYSRNFRDAMIGFGKGLLSFIKPILGSLVTAFKLVQPYIADLSKWLGDKFAPLIVRLTPLLKPLGEAIGKFLVGDIRALIDVIKFLFPVLRLLGGWIFNLIGWMVDLLVPFVKFTTWLLGNLFPILGRVVNVIRASWDNVVHWTAIAWDAVRHAVAVAALAVVHAVAVAWGAVVRVVKDVWNAVVAVFKFAFAVIESIIWIWVVLVRAIFLAAFEWWRFVFKAFWGWIGPYVMGVLRPIARVLGTIIAGWVWIFVHAFNLIKAATLASIGWLKTALPAAWRWIAAVTARLWGAIAAPVSRWWHDIAGWITTAVNWVKGALADTWHWLVGVTARLWDAIAAPVLNWYHTIAGWITAALNWVKSILVGDFDWFAGLAVKAWDKIAAPFKAFWGAIKKPLTDAMNWIGKLFSDSWKGLVSAAETVGGDVLRTLKAGFETAWNNISAWIKAQVVDPIINGVKHFFGISTSSGGSTAKSGGKASPAAAGRQGGGGTATATATAAAGGGGGSGGPAPGGLWGDIGGMFKGMVSDVVTSDPLDVAKTVFGSVERALGYIVVKGLVLVEDLGKDALSALEGIPGVKSLMGFLGGLWSGAVGFGKGLLGIGKGGPGAAGLVSAATAFNGHQYVWGGGANSQTGFDCSSFVNMLAGSMGLPIPGGFHAPSDQHGPVTGNWLTFNALKTIPYEQMMPGDIYVNPEHMGIVTGKGTGFAARSTDTGTGPQTVPRGAYTIRRFPGGGVMPSGVTGTGDLLAESLAGLLSHGAGLAPVVAGTSTANLRAVANYMATNGWSLPGAAGVAGNVYRESGGDPLAFGSGGRGLIGWTPPGKLPSAAFVPGNPSLSLSRQLPLVDTFFVNNMGAKMWRLANAQSDAGKSALVIMNTGERPAGSSQSDPFYPGSGTSAGSQRAAMARTIFEELRKSALVKMAGGGVISEPVAGVGASGTSYLIGEAGHEAVLPASLMKQLLALLKKVAAPARHSTLGSVTVGPSPVVNVILPAAAVPASAKTAAAAAAVTTAATKAATSTSTTAAKDAAKKSAAAATALAKAQAENTKRLHEVQKANAERLAKAQAENAKELSRVHASGAQRRAVAAAENAKRDAEIAEQNAARLAKAARSSATARNKAAAENAAHQAALATENANRLAKAAATSAKQLSDVEKANAARLAKAKLTDANNLAKVEAENAARLSKAQKAYSSAAAAASAAAAGTVTTAAAAVHKPFHPTLASVMVRSPLQGEHAAATIRAAVAKAAKPHAAAASAAAAHAAHVAHEAHLDHLYTLAHPAPARRSSYVPAVREGTARYAGTVVKSSSTYQQQEAELARRMGKYGSVTIHVHPTAKQSETEIAAAVSRTINWAAQGGMR